MHQIKHLRAGLAHCDWTGQRRGKAQRNPAAGAVISCLVKASLLSPPHSPACKEWPGLLPHSSAEVGFAAASPATSAGPCAAWEVRSQQSDTKHLRHMTRNVRASRIADRELQFITEVQSTRKSCGHQTHSDRSGTPQTSHQSMPEGQSNSDSGQCDPLPNYPAWHDSLQNSTVQKELRHQFHTVKVTEHLFPQNKNLQVFPKVPGILATHIFS